MTTDTGTSCDLAVIGTGMAGTAAAVFAANRGLTTVQVGSSGEIIFASGLIDLMGVHPLSTATRRHDPWQAIDDLIRDDPDHPYAHLSESQIRAAVTEFLTFLKSAGLAYCRRNERNVGVLTPMGTIKPTYCVPAGMWPGARVVAQRLPCVLVDIRGLKGFSARQIAQTRSRDWPVRTARIVFPDSSGRGEIFPEQMARSLDLPENRIKLAACLRPLVKDAAAVGLPAILGMYRTAEVSADLTRELGVPVFEIPTMPPSIPGLRLKEAFEAHLPAHGVRLRSLHRVLPAPIPAGKTFRLQVEGQDQPELIRARGVLLASGRFLGKGLAADSGRIRETVFDLSVAQPQNRRDWHRPDFLDRRGHPINRAGLRVDRHFRPLKPDGQPAFETLFAAGSILAHQDWMRMKCGAGLAIASAYGAVEAFAGSFH
jgi:glycerol-3-phosphate dehydrogenase subunit B